MEFNWLEVPFQNIQKSQCIEEECMESLAYNLRKCDSCIMHYQRELFILGPTLYYSPFISMTKTNNMILDLKTDSFRIIFTFLTGVSLFRVCYSVKNKVFSPINFFNLNLIDVKIRKYSVCSHDVVCTSLLNGTIYIIMMIL